VKLPAPLAKKIGPWPLGVWLGLALAGVAIGIVWRMRSAANEVLVVDPDPSAGLDPADLLAGGPLDPATLLDPQPAGTPIPTRSIETNDEWVRAAVAALVGSPEGGSAFNFEYALGRWLAGRNLTASQRLIVDRAVALVGPPPEAPEPFRPPTVPPAPGPTTRPSTLAGLSAQQLIAECGRSAGDPHSIPARFSISAIYAEMLRRGVSINSLPKNSRCAGGYFVYAQARGR